MPQTLERQALIDLIASTARRFPFGSDFQSGCAAIADAVLAIDQNDFHVWDSSQAEQIGRLRADVRRAREALRLADSLHGYTQGCQAWTDKIEAWLAHPAVVAALTEIP